MTWSFFIARRPPSLNERIANTRHGGWKYKREREDWRAEIRAARDAGGIPKATGPRVLLVRRLYKGREQERDYINLVGGCKALVDALVLEGLLVDDAPAMLVDCYEQERVSKERESGVWFELGDLTAGHSGDPDSNPQAEVLSSSPLTHRSRNLRNRAVAAPDSSESQPGAESRGTGQTCSREHSEARRSV